MKASFIAAALALGLLGCRHPEPGSPAQTEAPKSEAPKSEAPKVQAQVFELAVTDPAFQDRLLRGFYPGSGAWKWTGRKFAVSLDVPPPLDASTTLTLDCTVPTELMKEVREVTVTARVNGEVAGSQKYTEAGRYYPEFNVPAAALKKSPAEVEFELDRSAKDAGTGREIGLIVVGVLFEHPASTVVGHDPATELARQGYLQLLKQRQSKLSLEKQNELMKLFHDLPVWAHMWFENVPIEKNPLDLWMMQQIIYEVRPDFIIETGTFKGGSALYWAYTLNGMGLENSRVFTMDIQDLTPTAAANPLWKKYVTFYKASSTAPEIVGEIAKRVKGHKVLVTLDSDHSAAHVLNELHAYAPMVSRSSYLVVEDTHIDGVPTQPNAGPGPLTAVLQFLKEGGSKDFEQDFSREALIMTFNPGGWLRRK